MITREDVESTAKRHAGINDTVGDYWYVRTLGMFDMYVHKDDKSVSPHLAQEGFWESWITTWILNNVDASTYFIDIGANTGYYSLLAANLNAMVSAFEPNPEYYKMIQATMKRGGRQVLLSDLALSNYTGEAVLNIPIELHGSASLSEIVPGYETKKVNVQVKPLDEFMSSGDYPTVIKIDAEGEEERILEGMKEFLANTKDKTILMEYTPGAYSEHFLPDLFNYWNVTWINHGGYEGAVSPEGLLRQTDWVMLVLRPKS